MTSHSTQVEPTPVKIDSEPVILAPPQQTKPELPLPRTLDAHRHLGLLAERVTGCTGCDLHKTCDRKVFMRGSHKADVMFVGGAPSEIDVEQGAPIMGHAGQLLDRIIEAMGLLPSEVCVATICRCAPPAKRDPTMAEMNACLPFLHEQIVLIQPRVIVALGMAATRGLLQTEVGIKGLRGTMKLYRRSIPVMPTFHPAFLLRETEAGRIDAKRDVWADMQLVMELLGRPVKREQS